jgi:hypothetical protein
MISIINRIHDKFKNAIEHLNNQSLALHFYDLSVPGQPKDQIFYMVFLIASFILLGIAYKLKIIHFR